MNPLDDEDFLEFESKLNEVMKMLEDVNVAGKSDADATKKPVTQTTEISEENVLLHDQFNRTLLNRKAKEPPKTENQQTMDKFSFMKQMEEDAEQRTKMRRETEQQAQKYRKIGNDAFHASNYEKAILMYTKAIELLKDSPILYNNRALSYIKLGNYKRAVMDADHVIQSLDEKNLRSWLYRATAFVRLGDEAKYQESIKFVKEHNPKLTDFIDSFQDKMCDI